MTAGLTEALFASPWPTFGTGAVLLTSAKNREVQVSNKWYRRTGKAQFVLLFPCTELFCPALSHIRQEKRTEWETKARWMKKRSK